MCCEKKAAFRLKAWVPVERYSSFCMGKTGEVKQHAAINIISQPLQHVGLLDQSWDEQRDREEGIIKIVKQREADKYCINEFIV